MKNIIFILIASFLISCNCKNKEEPSNIKPISEQQTIQPEINLVVKDTIDDNRMLIGKINKKGFENKEFEEWYNENFNIHNLDEETSKTIKSKLKGVKIKAFMGTWCSDSQREIPALYKILEASDFDFSNFNLIAVDHDKETPNHLEKDMDIQYVPTIIFYKNGKEIGRFVEAAQETLEKDMLAILNETGYKHIYEE